MTDTARPSLPRRSGRRVIALGVVGMFAAGACASDTDDATAAEERSQDAATELVAQVASYELVADRDQRFIVGMFGNDDGVVSFGTARLDFDYLGTEADPLDEPRPGPSTTATFLPIPGSAETSEGGGARFTSPSEARGVYGAESVRFDEPGFWEVEVTIDLDGAEKRASAAFEVGDEQHVPVVGDPAPKTDNLLPGDADAPVTAIDSRADDDGSVPDPELHQVTIDAAIAAGKPVMVVVSTPVFCVSQFCGPITDTVQQLAQDTGDEMAFVHLEVWRDFENNAINRAAAEWIWPDQSGDPGEPWVFVVDAAGTIVQRWDNVVTERDLETAIQTVLED